MHSDIAPVQQLFPGADHHAAYRAMLDANPLPKELKRSVLEALLEPCRATKDLLDDLELDVPARPLSSHEQLTLDAVLDRGHDHNSKELLKAMHRTRGGSLTAWADVASIATRIRVELYA